MLGVRGVITPENGENRLECEGVQSRILEFQERNRGVASYHVYAAMAWMARKPNFWDLPGTLHEL